MREPEPYERLDKAMNERRLTLRMNWREVAEAAGISYTALRAIRRGKYRPTELTALRLDEALQWAQGSTFTILGGDDLPSGEDEEQGDEELTEELELAQRLLAATIREMNLSPEEADAVWRRVRPEIVATHRSTKGDGSEKPRNQRTG
ncbi:helix-turn-helix domain-containing protein [Streptomyces sp. NPDC004838]